MHNPHVKPLADGRNWELEADYILNLHDGRHVFIPKGFVFDFASIPRLFWRLFPPATGKHRLAALVHDWLCASGHDWYDSADIFLKLMEYSGVKAWKRYSMYYAVKMHGWFRDYDIVSVTEWKILQSERLKASKQIFHGRVI